MYTCRLNVEIRYFSRVFASQTITWKPRADLNRHKCALFCCFEVSVRNLSKKHVTLGFIVKKMPKHGNFCGLYSTSIKLLVQENCSIVPLNTDLIVNWLEKCDFTLQIKTGTGCFSLRVWISSFNRFGDIRNATHSNQCQIEIVICRWPGLSAWKWD